MQKRLYDSGWSDAKKCRGCNKEEGMEKHRLYHCPSWREIWSHLPEGLGKREQRAKTSEEAKGDHVASLERRHLEGYAS